jgi:hypothetical protein
MAPGVLIRVSGETWFMEFTEKVFAQCLQQIQYHFLLPPGCRVMDESGIIEAPRL